MSVLVVTGGGRGIGSGICRLAGERGWSVCVNFTAAEEPAASVVNEIEAAGGRAISVQGDVANEEDVERLFREATDRLGPVTGLVNNAGIMGSGGPVDELDRELTRRMFDVNLLGPFLCCKAAIRRMAKRHGGHPADLSLEGQMNVGSEKLTVHQFIDGKRGPLLSKEQRPYVILTLEVVFQVEALPWRFREFQVMSFASMNV